MFSLAGLRIKRAVELTSSGTSKATIAGYGGNRETVIVDTQDGGTVTLRNLCIIVSAQAPRTEA